MRIKRAHCWTIATHDTRGLGGTWDWTCVPVVSRLNHDGRPNGIVTVQAITGWPFGTLVDVGACTLTTLAPTGCEWCDGTAEDDPDFERLCENHQAEHEGLSVYEMRRRDAEWTAEYRDAHS